MSECRIVGCHDKPPFDKYGRCARHSKENCRVFEPNLECKENHRHTWWCY